MSTQRPNGAITTGDQASLVRRASGIRFLPAANGRVSVVMCTRDNAGLTIAALEALVRNTEPSAIEVILVDDGSGPAAREVFAAVAGLTILRNEASQGFLRATNAGLAVARGQYVLLLNNDTEVQEAWLPPLLALMSDPTVGAVGSRLLNADGTVQEAGVTIWSDGNGHAHAAGAARNDEEWLASTEVDYCSAAALMVRGDLIREIGGLDTRYAPAYYEDVDLCFEVRARQYRVLVCPESDVLHHGGQSYGSDVAPGKVVPRGKVNQYANRHIFAAKWAHVLAREHLPRGSVERMTPFAARSRPTVLLVDSWIPAADRDAGGLRMTWIVRLLNTMGVDVTLWATGGPPRDEYARAFRRMGIEVWIGESGHARLARRTGLYDAVLVSRPDVGAEVLPTVRMHCSRAPLLYDTVDVHHVRMQRHRNITGDVDPVMFERVRDQEERLCAAADVVVTVSEADADHLVSILGQGDPEFCVLPVVQPPWPTRPPVWHQREGLLFIGGYRHPPNCDAVQWFADDVWPSIPGRAELPVALLGDVPPPEVSDLARSHGFDVPGFMHDVTPNFDRARVFICPLRFGSGVKGKICQALAAGLPIVTTSIGIEGMDLEDGVDVLVRDDPGDFAEAIVRLHDDEALWTRLSLRGLETAAAWSPEAMERRLAALMGDLLPPRVMQRLVRRDATAPAQGASEPPRSAS